MLQGDRRASDSHRQIPERRSQVTALVAAAQFMENLDSNIIMTGAPAGGAILRSRPIGLNIGVTAYTLTLAVVTPISG
jgi:hypothetical protein